MLRQTDGERPGKPSQARPATAQGQGGSGEYQSTRYRTLRLSNEFPNYELMRP